MFPNRITASPMVLCRTVAPFLRGVCFLSSYGIPCPYVRAFRYAGNEHLNIKRVGQAGGVRVMSDEIILTPAGKRKLEEELDQLRSVEMPALSERIRQARELGDLSENFDYQDAKRQQGFVGGRIKDIEVMLSRAKIVESTGGADVVGMGSIVRVMDLEYDEEATYTLVGASESDPANNRLSVSSPIGKSLMGKKAGAKVRVETPGGTTDFEILEVS